MWNSSKPIKFPHLWKLANQSTLNKAHMIEKTKACKFTFMKARDFFAVRIDRNVSIGKRKQGGQDLLFKAST